MPKRNISPAEYKRTSNPNFLAELPDKEKLHTSCGWFVYKVDDSHRYIEYEDHEVTAQYLIAPEESSEKADDYWYASLGFQNCLEWLVPTFFNHKYVIKVSSPKARTVPHFHCHLIVLGKKIKKDE